ncbi:SDR family NAD(P)-dependent oxidoreductase [Fredinandcohnia sp. QZ13]|uniref:SDR family NAD(P)-dependent oxidoreductase n=1 Tax=Fredinandcohnia sp. QZ13 TaxID=3073144 RepID=UPI0028535165|nr:SDR family NAD(P)-dependent oxidoreductase [Fredinandcohnia sp. QZ13]MDR4887500.1 SDR family NAD(P)-dependent oxidoreductase [Fredinandcohnia sp. QZ13]
MRLKEKKAIVTGAGRGIGLAIAKKFLQEGAQVVICDINEENLNKAEDELRQYGEVYAKKVNITDRSEVESLVAFAKEKLGRIDVLANNAGIAHFEPFLEVSDEYWNKTLSVNLTGTFLCSQVIAGEMVKQKYGSIVNMSSSNGILAEANLAHYNASKGGVKLLTKTMAIELAPYNIRANNVCPGFILTDLAIEGGISEKDLKEYTQKIPLNRYGKVEEVANAFCFLASDEASFITGTELVVDGGQLCQE